MKALEFDNVSFSYGEKQMAVKNLSFSVEEGEYICVLGKNGSGKSTIARLIDALVVPNEGRVKVFGFDTKDKKNTFEIRKNVGMVFQNPDNQMVATIVEDDIAFGPENVGIEREEIAKRIKFALETTGMTAFAKRPSANLSGGQKQRVAIAGVLALKPKLIILDEATSMLDPKGREEITQIVQKLNKEQGITVIAVTHYMEEAVNADRIIVTNGGKIVYSGTPKQVFSMEKMLDECGLCLPRPTYIFNRLKDAGVVKGDIALTVEEVEQAL